jgi:hypothetical protein
MKLKQKIKNFIKIIDFTKKLKLKIIFCMIKFYLLEKHFSLLVFFLYLMKKVCIELVI